MSGPFLGRYRECSWSIPPQPTGSGCRAPPLRRGRREARKEFTIFVALGKYDLMKWKLGVFHIQ